MPELSMQASVRGNEGEQQFPNAERLVEVRSSALKKELQTSADLPPAIGELTLDHRGKAVSVVCRGY
jgi:hypothetical protein